MYVFHGEEVFLLRYYLEQLHKLLVDELTESFNYTKLDHEHFELQTFVDAVESFPMMAEHTFIWVDDVDFFKLSESDREKMTELLSDIPEYCTVVFTYIATPWKPDKRLKKLYEAIENHAFEVPFDKQEHRDLIAWISRHFAARGKRISTDLWGSPVNVGLANYGPVMLNIGCFIGCIGFAILFNIHGPGVMLCGLGGALSWAIYLMVVRSGHSDILGYFWSALFSSVYSETMARIRKYPAISYLVVSIFPLIPGAGAYYTMNYAVRGDMEMFASTGIHTAAIAGILAGLLIIF